MIGLSLSYCVKDILYGEKTISDLNVLIASTLSCPSYSTWDDLIAQYCDSYWSEFDSDLVFSVLSQIFDKPSTHLIFPRLSDPHLYPMIASGHWVDSFEQIIWSKQSSNFSLPIFQTI